VVVEDVLTTGGSTLDTIRVARGAGATVVAALAIVNRSASPVDLGVPFTALAALALPTYSPDSCPLCRHGLPIVKPGSKP
jgi:orotate phosphoribosyltransferase